MSESFDMPPETDNIHPTPDYVQLNADNVYKVLKNSRIGGMSRRSKVIIILGILMVLAAAGYFLKQYLGGSEGSAYSTATIRKTTLTESIEATGTLSPVKESDMGFKNDDTITAINVEPGDHVTAGQVLAQQDTATLRSALQQAERSVEQDEINIKTAALTYNTNLKTLERQKKLYESGAVSQSDLDNAQDNLAKSELELQVAQSKLKNDQVKVEEARSDLEGATLVAPFDGIIGEVNGQVGQINGINASSATLLTIMSEELQLSALVNEADIGRIKVGQDVEFTSSTFADKTFTGQVLRITPQATTVSNVQYYPVLISCNDPDGVLMSGMTVSANIIVARRTDVLAVPMMAVSYAESNTRSNPGSASGKSAGVKSKTTGGSAAVTESVVLVMENNQAVIKSVVLGINDGSNYEVIQGLNEGDKVIVGSNQADAATSGSGSSSGSSKNTTRQNQGGPGMGGPPPGM